MFDPPFAFPNEASAHVGLVFVLVHDGATAVLDDAVPTPARDVRLRAVLACAGRDDRMEIAGGVGAGAAAPDAPLDDLPQVHRRADSPAWPVPNRVSTGVGRPSTWIDIALLWVASRRGSEDGGTGAPRRTVRRPRRRPLSRRGAPRAPRLPRGAARRAGDPKRRLLEPRGEAPRGLPPSGAQAPRGEAAGGSSTSAAPARHDGAGTANSAGGLSGGGRDGTPVRRAGARAARAPTG